MSNTIKNILVIRLSSIGDILLASPLLRLLRQRFPDAHIDFVIKSRYVDAIRTNPHLDTVYPLETSAGHSALQEMRRQLRMHHYELVVDIHNNFRSHYLRKIPDAHVVVVNKYKWRRFLLVCFGWNLYKQIVPVYQRYINTVAHLGVEDDEEGLEFCIDTERQSAIRTKLDEMGFQFDKKTVAIAPGASFYTKRWPLDYFIAVAKALQSALDIQCILLGDKQDAELTRGLAEALNESTYDVAGQLSLMESACALNCADVLLTNDTGLMHLATALGKPTVSIFGSTVKELGFFPVGNNVMVIENVGLSCRPCTHIGRKSCPRKHFKCMKEIEPQRVFDALASLLKT
ncbi:lipopolysaccharide heptosyltransferase II [candidate division KSB1 bacterium]|nr:lipopolysaccharide heptosyltransferase II [candidate division KSB1 bacterium]RQW02171.1 MAG: lipopolysaccharide heptosyltransferase II [candidate division KSB1 bacterium]